MLHHKLHHCTAPLHCTMKWLLHFLCFFIYISWLMAADHGSYSFVAFAGPGKLDSHPKRTKPTRYRYLSKRDFKNQRLRAVSAHGREDSSNSTETIKHSRISVALRAVYLLLIFSPVIISAPLAYIIPIFRNFIWFKLLVNIIGTSSLYLSSIYILFYRSIYLTV